MFLCEYHYPCITLRKQACNDFEMLKSPSTAEEYFNRKRGYYVILQAVADIDVRFIQTYAGLFMMQGFFPNLR